MDLRRSLLLIVTLCPLLLCDSTASAGIPLASVHPASSLGRQVTNLCKGADDPNLCVRTILPSLKGKFDPYQALVAEIDATARSTKTTLSMIASKLAAPNNPQNLGDCLSICKDQYEMILDSVNKALANVAQKNIVESKFAFSAVISYQQSCEDAFKETPGVDFFFAQQSNAIYLLAGNSLSIMDAINNVPH